MSAIHAPMFTGGDPYWGNVILLMNMNVDLNDAKGHTVTNSGGVSINGTEKAAAFSGSNYLYVDHADFALSNQDYTVEFLFKLNSISNSKYAFANTSSAYIWLGPTLGSSPSGTIDAYLHSNTTTDQNINIDTYYHVCWVRSGSVAKYFFNGVKVGDVPSPYSLGGQKFEIGNTPTITGGGSNGIDGFIKHLRITKGIARYMTNFTPPTAPFPTS